MILILFIHVFDYMFENKEVGAVTTMHFNAVFIVPFDDASNFLAVCEMDDHRSFRGHLLDVIIIFCVRNFRGNSLSRNRPIPGHLVLDIGQTGTNKFPVYHKSFLQGR